MHPSCPFIVRSCELHPRRAMAAQHSNESDNQFIARLIATIEQRDLTIAEQAARIHDLEKCVSVPGADRKDIVAMLSLLDRTGTGSVPWTSMATLVSRLDSSIVGADLQAIKDFVGPVKEDGTVSIAKIIEWFFGEPNSACKDEAQVVEELRRDLLVSQAETVKFQSLSSTLPHLSSPHPSLTSRRLSRLLPLIR